ncbi:hypothetical protein [Algoriphagus boritolerans]|uniref:hypothetical protein n=1 Tax=Algoriphagus boritolerans TaxID=308111 RepID=UPI000B2B2982
MKEFSFERFYFLIYPVMIFASSFILNDMFSLPRLKFLAWTLVLTILGYQLLVLDNNAKNYVLKPLLGVGEKYPLIGSFMPSISLN